MGIASSKVTSTKCWGGGGGEKNTGMNAVEMQASCTEGRGTWMVLEVQAEGTFVLKVTKWKGTWWTSKMSRVGEGKEG